MEQTPTVRAEDSPNPLSQALERFQSLTQTSSLYHDAAGLLSSLQQENWTSIIESSLPSSTSTPHVSRLADSNLGKAKGKQLSRKTGLSSRRNRPDSGMARRLRQSASGIPNDFGQVGPSPPTAKRQRRAVLHAGEDPDLQGLFESGVQRRSSIDTRSSQCCSSCSEGVPCVESDCEFQKEEVIPCMQPECKQPVCPDECLIGVLGEGAALYQGNIPSSSRLMDWDYTAWNPQLQRSSSHIPQNSFKDLSTMGRQGQDEDLQTPSRPASALPTPPSLVNNMENPFSPSTALTTPQSTNSSQAEQLHNASAPILSGTGMMFDTLSAEWNEQTFNSGDMGNGSPMFNCAWSGCAQPFSNQQEWTEHIHHAHVDPQMTFYCPVSTGNCPSNISRHPLLHLEADHGYNFLIDNQYSCPAPSCDSDQKFLNPNMLHNHFDQAHAVPASGSLFCQWNSCDTTFSSPLDLFSHLNEHHQLTTLLGTDVNSKSPEADTKYPLHITDAELSEDDTRNRCQWKTGDGGVCGAVCETESDLQTHVKEAHLKSLNNRVGYNCQWQGCSRPAKLGNKSGFTARGKLERHMASHTGYKMATCDICGAEFSAPQSMKQHRRLHTGEKPWKCRHCGKQFPQQSACTIHERTHTYEKPLQCPYPGCGARFSDSSNLAKHRKTHGEEGVHVCKFPGCNKSFHRLDQLKKHRAAHQNSDDASALSSELVKVEAEGSDEGSNLFEGYTQVQPLGVNADGGG